MYNIIVPWDFTEVAENALKHAVRLSRKVKADIYLVHIAKSDSDIPQLLEKINEKAQLESNNYNLNISAIVREGNIFDTIGEIANELDALLVVMGTHGIKGMQKLTGSWALKVIANSEIPYLVVQDAPKKEKIENIVVPIDFSIEMKQKLKYARFWSKFYDLMAYLFVLNSNDPGFKRRTSQNLRYTQKYLDESAIPYEIVNAEVGKAFWKQTIAFAEDIRADVILVTTTMDLNFNDYIFGADEQKIIANSAKIPVMAANPLSSRKNRGWI
jgi:nucleotide-binding universal stress UspA family protein